LKKQENFKIIITMAFNFEKIDPYRGREFEYDLVGKMNIEDPTFPLELNKLQEKVKKRGYQIKQKNSLPFKEAVEISKKFQTWDPQSPNKEFARELRLALAERLGLETNEQLENLKIYSAVGGPLDSHGIDCFIAFNSPGGKEYIVTYDVTKNPDKEIPKGADLLIEGEIPDPSDKDYSEKKFLETIDNYAAQSAIVLKQKMEKQQQEFERRAA